jgi:hypothetical protein
MSDRVASVGAASSPAIGIDHIRLELARDAHPGRVRGVGSYGRRADPDATSAEHGLDPG